MKKMSSKKRSVARPNLAGQRALCVSTCYLGGARNGRCLFLAKNRFHTLCPLIEFRECYSETVGHFGHLSGERDEAAEAQLRQPGLYFAASDPSLTKAKGNTKDPANWLKNPGGACSFDRP